MEYNTYYCYTVTATYADTKSEQSEEVCVKTLGECLEELTSSFSFNIYPNPVKDMLFIEAEIEIEEVVAYDTLGRQQSTDNGHRP